MPSSRLANWSALLGCLVFLGTAVGVAVQRMRPGAIAAPFVNDLSKAPIQVGPLRCKSPHVDFGVRYRPVGLLEHNYRITNDSERPIKLHVAQTSCTCAGAEIEPESLEPGQTAAVHASWNAPNQVGSIGFAVYVGSDVPGSGILPLTGRLAARDVLQAQPTEIDLGSVCPGAVATATVQLTSYDEPISDAISLGPTSGGTECLARIVEKTKNQLKLQVRVTGTAGLGKREYEVRVETHSTPQPEIVIPVSAEHLAQFRAVPSDVLFNRPEANSIKWVEIEACSGDAAQVDRVEADREGIFDFSVRNSESGAKIGISIVSGGSHTGHKAGTIHVFVRGQSGPIAMSYLAFW